MKSFKHYLEEGSGPTRKHFQQVANLVKMHPDANKRKELALHHASIFATQNPRFDKKKFLAAANVSESALDELKMPSRWTNFKHALGSDDRSVKASAHRISHETKSMSDAELHSLHKSYGKTDKINPAKTAHGSNQHMQQRAIHREVQKRAAQPKTMDRWARWPSEFVSEAMKTSNVLKTYHRNETNNAHTANLVHLAKHFGDDAQRARAAHLASELKKHGNNIHVDAAYALHKELWPKLMSAHKAHKGVHESAAINELSGQTLKNYISKAVVSAVGHMRFDKSHPNAAKKDAVKAKRLSGISKASSRLKEDAESLDVSTLSVDSIAKKHGVSVEQIEAQLKKGIEVETEHTTDADTAKEIALDHLNEKPDYYTQLAKIEDVKESFTHSLITSTPLAIRQEQRRRQ